MPAQARHVGNVETFSWSRPGTEGRTVGKSVSLYVQTEDDDPEPYVRLVWASWPSTPLTPAQADHLADKLRIAAGLARAAAVSPETDRERADPIL